MQVHDKYHYRYFCLLSILFLTIPIYAKDVKVERPIGVSLTKKVLYDRARDFTCLDGSKTLNFRYVNDDYCDCPDGSDEPGTSACPNGVFHCINAGYRPKDIPSSHVNDGVCDCCDGSDEWRNQNLCPNTCVERQKFEREKFQQQMEEANRGYIKRRVYAEAGQAKKEQRKKELSKYHDNLVRIQEEEAFLLREKDEFEAKEKQILEKRRQILEEEKLQQVREKSLKRGARAYAEMDADRDASLTINELRSHYELDPDPTDGDFTESEAEGLLSGASVDLKQFMEFVWSRINDTFQTSVIIPVEELEEPVTAIEESKEEDFIDNEVEDKKIDESFELSNKILDQEDEYYDDAAEEDNIDNDYEAELTEEDSTDSTENNYDGVTRTLMEQAQEARKKFQENQNEKRKIESQIGILSKALSIDFGEDESYQALESRCFELVDVEYRYKLCLFDKTSQSPKNGGSETVLGRWGSWSGPEGHKYSVMKFENGLACWNGPARSTEVRVRCGADHKFVSVDEPSRCTYVFVFVTPCACEKSNNNFNYIPRDEL